MWPSPNTTHLSEVSPSRPTGPRACSLSVEMPICEQVYRVIHEGASPKDAVKELMKY